jgi:hypothetical protein
MKGEVGKAGERKRKITLKVIEGEGERRRGEG